MKSNALRDDFPVTISQYIQDIHTKIDAQVEAPKPKAKALKSIPTPLKTIPENLCPRCGYQLFAFPFESTKIAFDSSKISPTVPSCISDYLQNNANALKSKKRRRIGFPLPTRSIDLFDSKLFKWKFIAEGEKFHCRRFSPSNNNKTSSAPSWVTMLHCQRQLVPLECSSWNISLHRSQKRNPCVRTGLSGRSVFSDVGPNRYFILFFLHQYDGEFYLLLEKTSESKRWSLPKTSEKPVNRLSRSLISGYVDHPLNTDQSWLEIELLLIEDNDGYSSSRQSHWFSLRSFFTFEQIEKFDRHLIKSYLFK